MQQSRTAKMEAIRYHECPHCHHEVMVRADGMCIACGKSFLDRRGVDPDKTMVFIENVSTLPTCCFVCGKETERRQTLKWVLRIDPCRLPWFAAPIVKLFSFLPGSEYRLPVEMRLPVCPHCVAEARKAKPLSIRSGLDCMMLVHRNFRSRFEALNGRQKLEWDRDTPISNAPPPSFVPVPTIKML